MMRGLAGKRILIVEDQHLVAELERATLEWVGAIVLGPVDNEPAAFALISDNSPDVVALDWNLHGHHPLRFATYLKGCAIPFVIVSGYERNILPPEVRSALFVQKPFAQDELVQVLAGALRQAPPEAKAGP
jgi:DNA-binding response OmpR family regulator